MPEACGGFERIHDQSPTQKCLQERLNEVIGCDDVQSRHGAFRDIGWWNRAAAFTQKFQGHDTGATLFALGKALKHLIRALRSFSDDELQIGT